MLDGRSLARLPLQCLCYPSTIQFHPGPRNPLHSPRPAEGSTLRDTSLETGNMAVSRFFVRFFIIIGYRARSMEGWDTR